MQPRDPLSTLPVWAPITGCTPSIARWAPAREKGGLGPLLGRWSHSDRTDVCVCLGFWLRKPSAPDGLAGPHWRTYRDRWMNGRPGILSAADLSGRASRKGHWSPGWDVRGQWDSKGVVLGVHLFPNFQIHSLNPGLPCRTYTPVS